MQLIPLFLSLSQIHDIEAANPPNQPTEPVAGDTHGDFKDTSTTKLPILPPEHLLTPLGPPSLLSDEELRLPNFLEHYDPHPTAKATIPPVWPMCEHRMMVRTMFLDDILHATARLNRHNWILNAGSEKYANLQCNRWDEIHEDLLRYTKAVKSFEYWQGSFMNKLNLKRESIPPDFGSYGRTLAILECAAKDEKNQTPEKAASIADISRSFVSTFKTWSDNNAHNRYIGVQEEKNKNKVSKKRALVSRLFAATFGGLTLIVPMLIMVMDQRRITTVLTTCLFSLAVGFLLAIWMDDSHNRDIIALTAGYAAVLVVFVGSSER